MYTLRQLRQVKKATGVMRPLNMLRIYQALSHEWKLVREIAREADRTTSQTSGYLRILFRLGYVERKKVVLPSAGEVVKSFAYRRNGKRLI